MRNIQAFSILSTAYLHTDFVESAHVLGAHCALFALPVRKAQH